MNLLRFTSANTTNIASKSSVQAIIYVFIFTVLIFSGCQDPITGPSNIPSEKSLSQFKGKVSALMNAINVKNYGYVIATNKEVINTFEQGITTDTEFPIDEIDRMLYSTSTLRLVESDQLNISESLANKGTVKEILSFTNRIANANQDNFMLIMDKITSTGGKDINGSVSGLASDLNMNKTSFKEGKIHSTLQDLFRFSQAIDNQKLFETEDTHELMFRPVYLDNGERMPTGLGCFIHLSDNGKIIWSAGQSEDYASLLIKSESDSISLILVAQSQALNKPLKQDFGNLLNSTIYYAFSQYLLTSDSLQAPEIDYFDHEEAIKKAVVSTLETDHRDKTYHELLAYAKLFNASNHQAGLEKLSSVYGEVFVKDPPISTLLSDSKASITNAMDYMQYKRPFTLDEEKSIGIFGTAEYSKQMLLNPWEYDLVDLYFDISHERAKGFNTSDDRQYRFHYDWAMSTGNAPTLEGFLITQSEPTANSYNLEVMIPRETFFNTDTIRFVEGMQFGFDLLLSDNDGNGQESILSWCSDKGTTPWTNTSTYGSMLLVNYTTGRSDTAYFAPKSKGKITLDGKNTGEWNGIPFNMPKKEFNLENTKPEDLSGRFRFQWDENNIYFFIEVSDEFKKKIEKTADFGWITNADQDTVWIQSVDICEPAGGDASNFLVSTTTRLPAGDYVLHYVTNQSHSFGRWTKERPQLTFSGIMVY